MYHDPQINLITIISGITSLILIITFFVMGYRLKMMKRYLMALSEIEIARSKNAGMLEVRCPVCEKLNYVLEPTAPLHCLNCKEDISKMLAKILESKSQSRQTAKTDNI